MHETHSRRHVLQWGAATTLATVARHLSVKAAEPSKIPRVDAHLHCFAGKNDARFPYHPRGPYGPEQAATPEHLLACMQPANVDYAVVVHPEPYQDDHRYLEHCL